MALITTADKNKLYTQVKHELGFPLRPFEIKDDMMDSYLEMVIEDYSSLVNSWLIQQQWVGLEGLNVLKDNFLEAFSIKSNDYMESFTRAYSKQVSLSNNGYASNNWQLRRDFIVVSAQTQHYVIPANRSVQDVMWETPPPVGNAGLVDPYVIGNSLSAGMFGWNLYGVGMRAMQPIYSTLLAAQDMRMKQRVLQSTLTYRLTALSSGEKLLHLYPLPGSRNEISSWNSKDYEGRLVFYWYYDTSKENLDKCLEENDDIVRLPSDVPISTLKWEKLNTVAKRQIRDLLIAKTKIVIGSVRGFYEGSINVGEAQLKLDYRHLLDEGTKLKEETEKNIMDQLEKLKYVNLTEERAKVGENVNQFLTRQPPTYPILTI